jgi:hypothetical protein
MSNSSFNYNPRNLTPEQQRLITTYINQYNQTNVHIDVLLDMLDDIRRNIINIINTTQSRRTRINRHTRQTNSNTSFNRLLNQFLNDRQNNYVRYDYDNPISPIFYNDFNINNNMPNNTSLYDNISNIFSDSVPISQINNTTVNRNISTLESMSNFLNNFLNTNIIVRPTPQQIESSTRIIRYGDVDNPLSESCPISLDNFNQDDMVIQILHCGHLFHQEQFNAWFESSVRCPVCRYDIRNYRPLSRRNTPNNINNEQSNNSNSTTDRHHVNTESTTTSSQPESDAGLNHPNRATFDNINIIRDPISNQIEQFTFDISDTQFTNNFLDSISRNIFQSLLNPHTQNNNERFIIDPSNNTLYYETILRPNRNQNQDNNDDDN